MELEDIILEFKKVGEILKSFTLGIDFYLFGSILINHKKANDIDILIIYTDYNNLSILRRELNKLNLTLSFDICYFTVEEENELNFIQDQKAMLIFSI